MKFFACACLIAILSLFCPASVMGWVPWLGGRIDLLARHRRACIVGIFILSLLFSAGWNVVLKTPVPRVNDEFGYLLEGDTYSRGRLKNPTPPMWRHFETFHVIFQPGYTAKFPPAQGATLAIGELLGKPIIGVWLGTAFACAAILWMLFAWLPPRWAIPISLLAVFNPEILTWNWTYWGGGIALGAGALVLGAYRRLADPLSRDNPLLTGGCMGAGMAILAVSRPYEGCLMCATVTFLLLFDLARTRRLSILLRAAPLCVTGLVCVGAFILHYNKSITGNALFMPYVLYERTYDAAPLFLWQKLPPIPHYGNATMRDFYMVARQYAATQQTLSGFFHEALQKLANFAMFFWQGLALFLLIALPLVIFRDTWLKRALIIALVSASGIAMSNYVFSHYEAPVLPLLFVFLGACMQRIWAWRAGNRLSGAAFCAGMMLLLIAFSLFYFFIRERKNQSGANWGYWRNQIAAALAQDGHKHLVLIHYSPSHDLNQEWVYNRANLDASSVIWARDLGPASNSELVRYYNGREIWVFDPDTDSKPKPYQETSIAGAPKSST